MIVADIVGGLGNQMFCYAATKAIARDLGQPYRYRICPPPQTHILKPVCNHEGSIIDKLGQEYNPDFERFFHIDTTERLQTIPKKIRTDWTWKRNSRSNYAEGVYGVSANTHLKGFFLHPAYFAHRRDDVLRWFRFKDDYLARARLKSNEYRAQTGGDHLVSIHLRGGLSYRLARQTLDPDYHRRAMDFVRAAFPSARLVFVLFSDVPKTALQKIGRKHPVVLHTGTMFEDLCLMTQCDSHIVVNSTFSWWGAWLAQQQTGIVVRPSIWPASEPRRDAPTDMFPSEWISLAARRERLTWRCLFQRLRDEYSPFRDPCEDYPSWFDHYVRKPLRAVRQKNRQSIC